METACWVSFVLREFRNCETSEDTNVLTTTIVISGPYRFSRNPMYVSLTLMLLGVGCQCLVDSGDGRAGAGGDACGCVLREKRYLEQKFGQVYREY
jgi:protein-S-isoprenylcysteine O-methyltransferase Ste14